MEILATSLVKSDMPIRCADCDHQMLLSPDGMTTTVACENCGGTRLERDQPSPTHSDFDTYDMVDPGIGDDPGGNPLAEGMLGDWSPLNKRDESFASSVHTAMDNEIETTIGPRGIHNGVLNLLHNFHSITIDGHPVSYAEDFNRGLRARYANHQGTVRVGSHHPAFTNIAAKIIQSSSGNPMEVANEGRDIVQGIQDGSIPAPPKPQSWEGPTAPGLSIQAALDFSLFDRQPDSLFIANPEGKVISGPHSDYTHETLAAKHGWLQPNAMSPHKGNTLGVLNSNGDIDFVQHENGMSPGALESVLYGHFGHPVVVNPNLQPTTNEERWFGPGATDQSVGTMRNQLPSADWAADQRAKAEEWRGRPFRYTEDPFINRGGSVTARVGERTSNMEPYLPWQYEEPMAKTAGPLALLPEALALGGGEAGGGLMGGLLGKAIPGLMRGALMGTGSNMVQGLFGGGQSQQSVPPPQPQDLSQLASIKQADLETPHSNPVLHDNPDGDTKQFSDGDNSPVFQNPENQDSGMSGEDNVPGGIGMEQPGMDNFAEGSPGVERAKMLLPLLMHYHNDETSGANDPLIRELHSILESEMPGYLDKADDESTNQLVKSMREPQNVHAGVGKTAVGVYENTMMAPGQMQMGNQQMDMTMQPGGGLPGVGQQGKCPFCGGTQNADGFCPQCGAKAGPMGEALPGQSTGQPSVPQVAPGGVPIQRPMQARVAGDTQGPTTPEQIAAVQQLLIDTGRVKEVPNVPVEPWNYSRELAAVANKQNVTPNVDPTQTPPPPPQPPMDPSQQMPMPGMTGPGGQPAMPMQMGSSVRKRSWKIAAPNDPNVVDAPAADQQRQRDPMLEQDSSHSWQDLNGNPLETGQIYTVHNPQYSIPDIVRVEQIKPDAIVVSYIGTFQNSPSPDGQPGPQVDARHEIPLEEVKMLNLTFEKGQGGQGFEDYHDNANAPVNTEPQHSPDVEQEASSQLSHVEASADDEPEGVCKACGESQHITSSMSSATTTFHECYRCGNSWETKDSEYGTNSESPHLAWIMNDSGPDGDDFFEGFERVKAMREAGQGARSLSDIAAKDSRLREIHERLEENKTHREAGAKFTPREQREFVNESGVARNSDMLDLDGTHYVKTKNDYDRANAANVPDSHMFLGL